MRVVTSIIGRFFSRVFRRKVARARIVIDSDEIKEYQVSPRIANIVRIIVEASERLSRPNNIRLAVDCTGQTSVRVRIEDEPIGSTQ